MNKAKSDEKQQRLQAALRDNLKRRKVVAMQSKQSAKESDKRA